MTRVDFSLKHHQYRSLPDQADPSSSAGWPIHKGKLYRDGALAGIIHAVIRDEEPGDIRLDLDASPV